MVMDISLTHKKILETINESEKILIVIHVAPDGDALGVGCAFIEYLTSINKKFDAYCQDEIDLNMIATPKLNQFQRTINDFHSYDLVLALDCADSFRTGLSSEIKNRKARTRVINIDHHICNDSFGDINLIRLDYSSTAEIVHDLFDEMNITATKNIAHCLLAGIVYDTENFANPATTFNSMKAASVLMVRGANLQQILSDLYRNKTLPALRFWGQVFSGLHYNGQHDIAVSVVTQKDIKQHGLAEEIIDGMANFLSRTIDTKIILVLNERDDGTIKGSLRTNHDSADVKRVAEYFGGGGHVKSSGFSINGRLQRVGEQWVVV